MRSLHFSRLVRGGWRFGAVLAAGFALAACVTPPPRTVVVPAPPPPPQKIFVYPNNGQTPEQTDRDRYECHVWAVQQTGVDPSRSEWQSLCPRGGAARHSAGRGNAPPAPSPARILGSISRRPVAIPGAGFVLGAATGAIVGAAADANAQAQAKQTQQQINEAASPTGVRRPMPIAGRWAPACKGRGYTVR